MNYGLNGLRIEISYRQYKLASFPCGKTSRRNSSLIIGEDGGLGQAGPIIFVGHSGVSLFDVVKTFSCADCVTIRKTLKFGRV